MPKPSPEDEQPAQVSLLPILDDAADAAGAASVARMFAAAQQRMAFVLSLRERGVSDVALLRALETVPREIFVPHHFADLAWRDMALPIACGQTMHQPFAVAQMMTALELEPHHRVLEIGTGSGYATSVLAKLAREVVSCERFRHLARAAQSRLESIAVTNVTQHWADGFDLPSDSGVFDRILVDVAIDDLPRALTASLAPGGLAVFPRRASALPGRELAEGFYAVQRTHMGLREDFLFAMRVSAAISGRSAYL